MFQPVFQTFEKKGCSKRFNPVNCSVVFERHVCPNCGSGKVEPDTRHTNVLGEMIFNPDKWYCRRCDYTGLMPTEGEKDSEDISFEPVENRKIDTDAGIAYRSFIEILVVLSAIYVLYLTFL